METPSPEEAHKHSSRHRREIQSSTVCGCFYCLATFPPQEIEQWLNEGDSTALCPKCTIDSVIGSASGFPITESFLKRMHAVWFGGDKTR